MSEFQVGDILRWRGEGGSSEYKVLAIHGEFLWLKLDGQLCTLRASYLEKAPQTFEVGKTYRRPRVAPEVRFTVRAVDDRFAYVLRTVGQDLVMSWPTYFSLTEREGLEEVSDGS